MTYLDDWPCMHNNWGTFFSIDNKYSEIRSSIGGSVVATANTTNVLHCGQHRAFWASWALSPTKVLVGRGAVIGSEVLMTWDTPTGYPITSIGFSTSESQTASWDVSFLDGEYMYIVLSMLAFSLLRLPHLNSFATIWNIISDTCNSNLMSAANVILLLLVLCSFYARDFTQNFSVTVCMSQCRA